MEKIYLTVGGNTNRQGWEFNYTASQLLPAARKQKEYRDGRVKFWNQKKEEVMETVRSSGLQVHESMAEKMSSYALSNRGHRRGVEISIDEKLQQDLDECFEKIKEHKDLSSEYDAWIQVLEANPDEILRLKHHDWMFFFGK